VGSRGAAENAAKRKDSTRRHGEKRENTEEKIPRACAQQIFLYSSFFLRVLRGSA
jgi:hypothetical protein